MTLRPALFCHLLCSGFLRCASLFVPARQRSEWWREWQSELWHVRQACTPEHGISWIGEREVAAFCFGAFEDARCLRDQREQKLLSRGTATGSATQCLRLLIGLVAVSYGIAQLLPGLSSVLDPPQYHDARNLMLIHDGHTIGDSTPTISAEQYRLWQHRRQDIFDGFAFYRLVQEPLLNPSHAHATEKVAIASANLFELLGVPIHLALDTACDVRPTADPERRDVEEGIRWRSVPSSAASSI